MKEKSGDAGIYRKADFLRKVFDDYMISLLRIVMLWSFPFPRNHGYKAVVGSNCNYNCCQQLLPTIVEQICNSRNGPCCQCILMNGSMGPFKTTYQGREQCTCPKCLNRECMTLYKSDVITTVSASTVQTFSTHISTLKGEVNNHDCLKCA